MATPSPDLILELMEGFRRSQAMFATLALGVFDHLKGRPADAKSLADGTGTEPEALERLLDACVGLGLLAKKSGAYSNLPIADVYLCVSSPETLAGYALYSHRALYALWGHLEDAVREGSARWKQTFGFDGSLFSHFFRTDEARRNFLMGMHGFGLLSSPRVLQAFDLSRFKCLVDLGGGTGQLAIAACRLHPALGAVVFDLAPALEIAREYVGQAGLAGRIELRAGDFFVDPFPEADLYALGRILHDWSETKVRTLLAKAFHALPAGGGILVAERLLEEDKASPLPALLQSLNMLVCTEGKERTLGEYSGLLHEAGFTEVQGKRTGGPLDAVLGLKGW